MRINSWKPNLTSQFLVCPVPFHLDTYHGCTFSCKYCFARDFYEFSRRNSEHPTFSYLKGLKTVSLENWLEKTIKKDDYDYAKGAEVAIKERIPLKIGANSDPFPYIEKNEKITLKVLKIFNEYNYPLEIQTKNPLTLALELDSLKLDNINWNVAVSIVSDKEKFVKAIEPHSPSLRDRYKGIKMLTSKGINVMVKIQPVFYPSILYELESMVKRFKDVGCWSFNTEGLKIRKAMSKKEQSLYEDIGKYFLVDIKGFYQKENEKRNKTKESSDLELSHRTQLRYSNLAVRLAKKYNIKYFVADNYMGKIGDGDECCGTEVLKDYKLNCYNSRSFYWKNQQKNSEHIGECLINWTRASKSGNSKKETIKSIFLKKKAELIENKKQKNILDFKS